MLQSIIFWDASGQVVGWIDSMNAYDDDHNVIGKVDFEAHELAGGRLRDIKHVEDAVGGGTWLEWLGGSAYDFTVELDPNPFPARARITALVHKKSGHRRVRADIEAAITERINEKKAAAKKAGDEIRRDLKRRGLDDEMVALVEDPASEPADLRDLLGGPNRPLLLDEEGRTRPRPAKSRRPALPVVRRAQQIRA
jgi:hypothetical protein